MDNLFNVSIQMNIVVSLYVADVKTLRLEFKWEFTIYLHAHVLFFDFIFLHYPLILPQPLVAVPFGDF